MIDGNTAAALGCLYAGATVGAWYPITPSTSLMDAFKAFCERYRKDPQTGEKRYCIVQAEDELAAIGIVLGATWNGARAFTPTSGPGISLMSEFLGFAYFTELPAVLFDVQRVGPSTGMPTRTQQADILSAAFASHGDTKHVLLFPRDPRECFELAVKAFDLADRLQTPVIVMSDLDIGMNDWMCKDFEWDPAYKPDRGKVLTAEQLESVRTFHRYLDADGDGIPYRTLPGVHPRGAYFVRGSGHNQFGGVHRGLGGVPAGRRPPRQEMADRGAARSRGGRAARARSRRSGASWRSAARTPRFRRRSIGSRRRASIPTTAASARFRSARTCVQFLEQHERVFVVDQNRDAQLKSLLVLETGHAPERLQSILPLRRVADGLPLRRRRARARTRPKEWRHDVDRETEDRARRAQAQCARAHGPRLRRRHVDAVRRLRSRLDHCRDRASVLRARHPAARCREDERHRLLVQDARVLHERVARLQLGARPHAVDRDRRERRQPRRSICSACRATATRCRSASASSCTRCAAISTWCTSSRTTAFTASPRGNSPRRPTSAPKRSAAR